jgi:hypothetical protein
LWTKLLAEWSFRFSKDFCCLLFFFVCLLTTGAAFAADETFIASDKIANAKTQIHQLKALTFLPVIFPDRIPAPGQGQNFYLSYSSNAIKADYTQYWQLNVDVTPDCLGAHFCNVGYISAEKDGRISRSFETLPDKKEHLKELVYLPCHIAAYYTPFHIAASAVQPTLEWRKDNVKYTLSWTIAAPAEEQKTMLLKIVPSGLGCYKN